MIKIPKAYYHDFDGQCKPGSGYTFETFSVGVFQWLPKANGKGLKKSKVKYRVRGKTADVEKIYERAREVCYIFDCQREDILKYKSETIK